MLFVGQTSQNCFLLPCNGVKLKRRVNLNSFFAPLSPAQGDKLCVKTKLNKSQGCSSSHQSGSLHYGGAFCHVSIPHPHPRTEKACIVLDICYQDRSSTALISI